MNYIPKKIKRNTVIILFALLYAAVSTHAQTDEESIWRIKGFVDTYHTMRTDEPNNLMSSRTRVRGEIGRDFRKSSLFISFNATYNALHVFARFFANNIPKRIYLIYNDRF